ncbi:MAG TPA: ATP-binding protein, partial [Gammaproteobacteria bacterium]|nr:ATP-binding protein [Gammaproteobacteria bacterium]
MRPLAKTKNSYKLDRLEIYNWGTFDQTVWKLNPAGFHSLLTGDIGSGKSTIVDAITTLLVPHHKIVYNKAAGAENKERTLSSYIRGEYKAEKDDKNQMAKAVALRDHTQYSVLLAHFKASDSTECITLAQVFWIKDNQNTPDRFFVVSETDLTIIKDFSNFGNDLLKLKQRLKKAGKNTCFDRFKDYSQHFRHLMGIQNEQALELFYQTVSLKSVGNLTTFIQSHMLEKDDAESRIEELCHHFEDLNRAHHTVVKARQQIESLTILVDLTTVYEKDHQSLEHFRDCRESLSTFMAFHHEQLLKEKLASIAKESVKVDR